MPLVYATYAEFTEVFSVKNVSQSNIENTWLPHGALRVNEALGGTFTIPFSSNNLTAKDLSIRYAYLGILERTRNQEDSEELRKSLEKRIDSLRMKNTPMITTSGEIIVAGNATANDAWSNTQNYKPVFDMRDSVNQRIDPDRIDNDWSNDT